MRTILAIAVASGFLFNGQVTKAALAITGFNSPTVVNFDSTVTDVNNGQFTGGGFQSSPSVGQLDSDAWSVAGMSEGNLAFGGTATTGDFARGFSSGGVTTGGIYAFTVGLGNNALGVQPGGDDFTPGSFSLRIANQTGSTITVLEVGYVVYIRNDQPRANTFNFSYSTDGSNFTPISSLDLVSLSTTDTSPSWVANNRGTTISGLSVANDSHFFLRWTSDDVGGSGSRDEFALDDISITAVPEPAEWGMMAAMGLMAVCGWRTWRERCRLRTANNQ